MIFGKTKKEDGSEIEGRPLESAAINRWRSINGSNLNSQTQENINTSNVSLNEEKSESVVEEVKIISLDQVFEEDENVVRLPEERDDIEDLQEPLFNYHAHDLNNSRDEEINQETYNEELESLIEDENIEEEKLEEPLLASIEVEEARPAKKKTPARPPLERANFDIESEEDLKNRFGDNIQSALGSGTMIEGRFSFESPVRIDGSLKGEIKSSSALIVGKNATVNANIKVGALIILGSVEGEIEAEDLIEIRSSGTLLGDVITKRIALEEGGVFSGSCTMVE